MLVLLASLVLLGAFPLHAGSRPCFGEAPTAAGALVSASLPTIGVCALLRIGCAVLPEGMRWASGVVVALGAVTAIYGALGALGSDRSPPARRRRDDGAGRLRAPRRGLAHAAGALGRDGARVDARARVRALPRAGGRRRGARAHARRLRASPASRRRCRDGPPRSRVAALGQAGVMGLAGAWGPMLALLGALPNYPPLAFVAALALVLAAAAHFLALSKHRVRQARERLGEGARCSSRSAGASRISPRASGRASRRSRCSSCSSACGRRRSSVDDGHGARSDERGEPAGSRADCAASTDQPSATPANRARLHQCSLLGGRGGLRRRASQPSARAPP